MDTRALVTRAIGEAISTTVNFTTIPLAINPGAMWEKLKQSVDNFRERIRLEVGSKTATAKNKITQLTRELTTFQVADINRYRCGSEPATQPATDFTTTNNGPMEVANHIHKNSARAKAIVAALPGMWREAILAILCAIVLIVIGALGVSHPLMVQAMGANGEPSGISPLVWMVIASTALALMSGAINVTFFRSSAARVAPWHAVLVVIAFMFLTARYISSAMNSDFMLMQDMPPTAQFIIRILEAVGVGVALIAVEMGAGRALAFFWMRYQKTHNQRRMEQIIHDTELWDQLRAEWDEENRQGQIEPKQSDLHKTAAMVISEHIDSGLQQHRDLLRRHAVSISQPWTGSPLEHVDIDWLQKQVTDCELARDALLILAGLVPPPPTMPTLPPVPPAPPVSASQVQTGR